MSVTLTLTHEEHDELLAELVHSMERAHDEGHKRAADKLQRMLTAVARVRQPLLTDGQINNLRAVLYNVSVCNAQRRPPGTSDATTAGELLVALSLRCTICDKPNAIRVDYAVPIDLCAACAEVPSDPAELRAKLARDHEMLRTRRAEPACGCAQLLQEARMTLMVAEGCVIPSRPDVASECRKLADRIGALSSCADGEWEWVGSTEQTVLGRRVLTRTYHHRAKAGDRR